MNELIKPALAGAWTWVITYVFPVAVNLGLLWLTLAVLEPASTWPSAWEADWDADYRTAAIIGAVVLVAMAMAAMNTFLHKLLEGYVGLARSEKLWNWCTSRHLERRKKLEQAVDALENAIAAAPAGTSPGANLRLELWFERLNRYPTDDTQIGPTRYANMVRAFEMYGVERYGLDSQTVWTQLVSCAPEPARKDESDARRFVDFLINFTFLSGAAVLACGVFAVIYFDWRWLVAAAGFGLLTMCWRQMLFTSVSSWATTVRAVVDLGRMPLAKAFDLTLPTRLDDERQMWNALVWALRDNHTESIKTLARFRTTPGHPGRLRSRAPTPRP